MVVIVKAVRVSVCLQSLELQNYMLCKAIAFNTVFESLQFDNYPADAPCAVDTLTLCRWIKPSVSLISYNFLSSMSVVLVAVLFS